jgi:hypothetical protein
MRSQWKRVVCLTVALASVVPSLGCGAGGKAAGRAISRRGARSVERALPRILARDAERDAASAARTLSRSRSFQRYVTGGRLRQELRSGIAPGRHMAPARIGRPLSGLSAQRRYGLPKAPRYRETVRLPRGFPMKLNRAIGGQPSFGEAISPRRIPLQSIQKVVPLR